MTATAAAAQGVTAEGLAAHHAGGLTGTLGIELLSIENGRAEGRLPLHDGLMLKSGGYLHAGTVVALADSLTGWGCLASLPDHAAGFATMELKANLVGTTRAPDALACVATLVHGGRTTQVWDATVTRESDGRAIGHFRCTQFLMEEAR